MSAITLDARPIVFPVAMPGQIRQVSINISATGDQPVPTTLAIEGPDSSAFAAVFLPINTGVMGPGAPEPPTATTANVPPKMHRLAGAKIHQ